jgi:hypothetical protein
VTEPTPHETETKLADDYLAGAVLARQVSHKALEQALRDAEAGTLRDPAKTAMNAAITSGTLLDKRLVLQLRPNEIIGHTDPSSAINALARKVGLSYDSTATEITDAVEVKPAQLEAPKPPSEPLQRERVGAKPRARTRDRSVSPPAVPAAD